MNPITFSYQGAHLQAYTVTTTGTYVLDGFGAQGGNYDGYVGGGGAETAGRLSLQSGDHLLILAGGMGANGSARPGSGGGGGGTFVYRDANNNGSIDPSDTLLLAAGGGGGGGEGNGGSGGQSAAAASGNGMGGAGGGGLNDSNNGGGGAGVNGGGGNGANAANGGSGSGATSIQSSGASSGAAGMGGYGGGGGGGLVGGGGGGGYSGGAGASGNSSASAGGQGGTSFFTVGGTLDATNSRSGFNTGDGSVTLTLVLPPTNLTLDTSTDGGVQGENLTNIANAKIDGNATAGSTVTLYDGNTVVGMTIATAGGTFQITGNPTLRMQGANNLTATASPPVGGVTSGPSSPLTVTLDTMPPTVSTPMLAAGSDSGIQGDDQTNDTTPTVTGTAESGSTVTLYDTDGTTVLGSTTATGGSYSITSSTLGQGGHALTAKAADAAGNVSAASAPLNIIVDTTDPTITTVADSGPGVDANGNGDLGAAKTVALTVTTSEAVYVQGGTPTLTLNDGGTATYTGPTGTATNTLTFAYTVAAGQNTSALAVTAVNANGAAVTDAAGNPIDPSLAGATTPTGTLVIDTTAPVASSPTLTVAQNASATPIGIAAPSDNLTTAGGLAIVAGSLPTDGTVTLADGTTRVTVGESLTAGQLTGLKFTPTAGVSNQGSTFSYTATDGAGNATTGTAALNVGSPGAPTISGTHATATTSEAAVTPFAGVTVADPSAATETLTIALTGPGGTLTGTGLTANTTGSYSLTGSAATVTQQLDALRFTPTAGAAGTTSTTGFVLTDRSSAGTSVTDAGTRVTDTDPAAPVQPTPPPVAPDAVSIDPAVTYKGGVFTLTGTASSPAGVSSVEITAQVDGVATDLGAATVNADGTFTFADRIGANTQGFITATETDGAGGTASAGATYSLAGGLGPTGGIGRQDSYTADGSAITSTSLFRANGQRSVGLDVSGTTVDLQPFDIVANHHQTGTSFVFSPGDGLDVIHGFQVGGAGHDTLELPASDFTNLADVFRHTGDVAGSAFITDPKTGDAIRLAGVSTAELKAHPKDIAFHG